MLFMGPEKRLKSKRVQWKVVCRSSPSLYIYSRERPKRSEEKKMSLSFLARRAAQKERVRIIYRRPLKDTFNWVVHRHLFYPDADALREKFDANQIIQECEILCSEDISGQILFQELILLLLSIIIANHIF